MTWLIAHNENAPSELWDLEVLGRLLARGESTRVLGGRPTPALLPDAAVLEPGDVAPAPSPAVEKVERRLGIPLAREVALLERAAPSRILTSSRLPTLLAARLLRIPCWVRTSAFYHPAYHLPPIRVRADVHETQGRRLVPLRWKRALLARSWRQARTLIRALGPLAPRMNLPPEATDLLVGMGDVAILREPKEVLPEALQEPKEGLLLAGPWAGWPDPPAGTSAEASSRRVLLHVESDVALARRLEEQLRRLAPALEPQWVSPPPGFTSDWPILEEPWRPEVWKGARAAILESRDFYLWQAWRLGVPVIGLYRTWPERVALEDLARTGTAVFLRAERLRGFDWERFLSDESLEPARVLLRERTIDREEDLESLP